MHESGMSELVDTGNISNQIKRLIGKKYFMYFENTKILRLHIFKYKIHLICFKGIKKQNSILYFKYVF